MFTAVGDGLGDLVGGDRDHREVDLLVDLAERTVGRDAVERGQALVESAVHRVGASGVAGGEEVAQDRASDPAGGAAGADDGDGAGGEEALHRAGLGALFAAALDGEGLLGGFEVEGEVDGAVLEAASLGVPGVPEDLDHLVVRGKHLGGEPPDPAFAGDRRDVFEQRRGDAAALVGVLDEEGDLGLVGGGGGGAAPVVDTVVADGSDELAADRDGQTHPVDVVVMGEAVHVPVG